MAGDLGGGDEGGSQDPGGYVGREEFMTSIGGIMEMLQQISQRGECVTPLPPVPGLSPPEGAVSTRVGDDAPGGRPGKEKMVEGNWRDLAGRELFPSPASAVSPVDLVARVETARPLARGSPFCELVLSAPVPEGFREPEMVYYVGKDDPLQHLQWFEDAVSIRPMTDAFKCRLFAITLKDKARDWFHQLPAGSIYGFEDLSRSFQLRFSTSKKRKKNPESIFLIKQKADESLAQYVDRFQEEILDIQEVPGFALQMAFTVGLREGFFKMSLTGKAPLSFEGLMEKAAKEIAMEAANPAFAKKLPRLTEVESREPGGARQQEGRRREEPRGLAHQEFGWKQPEGPVQGQGRGLPPGGRNYYQGGAGRLPQLGWRHGPRPLPPPPQQAMAIGRGRGRGRERGRGGAGAGRRRNHQEGRQEGEVTMPFCDFHEEEGHATATCPEFLELKGRRGAGEQQPPARIVEMTGVGEEDRCVDRSDVGDRGGIGVIHGGVGIEATRKASLHTMYRRGVASTSQAPPPDEKITFSRKDLPDHEDPFCDALVIRTAIESFTVSRILVDNGSSVNVIFKKAFNEMRVEARRVLAADGPLFRFSGERKEVEGGVGLQVTLGGLSRNCRFVIMDAPSSYNAIFGRPLISVFRCVPSSFHQCLKLNSGGTQIRVRGDPKAARECYVTAVNTISWRGDAEELERRLEREEQEESRVEELGGGIAEEPVMAGKLRVGGEGKEVRRKKRKIGEMEESVLGGGPEQVEERFGEQELGSQEEGLGKEEEIPKDQEEEEDPSRLRAAVELQEVDILTKEGRKEKIKISGELGLEDQEEIRKCVQENIDIFAWSAADMPGIDADVACHRQQKKRAIASRMTKPIREEVEKLLQAGFISANKYPGWNAGAIYQRMMDRIFREQKGRNLEVYVDDLMIKSQDLKSHIADLEETFATVRKYKMRLNPLKCVFGASRGKFLGHLLTPSGVEPNPDKAQAVADFLVDYTVEVKKAETSPVVAWEMLVDGASGKNSFGGGMVLVSPEGTRIEQALKVHFALTNNQAEYEAIIAGLRLAHLLAKHGPRAGGTMTELFRPSIEEGELMEVDQQESWMDPFTTYLTTGRLPEGELEKKQVRYKSAYYLLKEGILYRKTLSGLLARCVSEKEVARVLEEIHSGECGSHSGSRTLEGRVLRQGYFWPTLRRDAEEFARKCRQCQEFAPLQLLPAQRLRTITAPWPFAIWGLDLVGPFPQASGQRRFLLVMVDYFSKWLEVKALAKVTSQVVKSFVWGEIICRHGLPLAIITDNGPQFASREFVDFCVRLGIDLRFASVHHPRSNGQMEAANKVIMNLLKKKVENLRGSWVEQLPSVLWALRTTPSSATGETPFKLSHGSEAVIPVEFEVESPRVTAARRGDEEWLVDNGEEQRLSLDLVEELRELTSIRQEEVKRRMSRYFDKHVRVKQFEKGDLVLKKVDAAGRGASVGKLNPNWEGPFIVKEVLKSGGYHLQDVDGTPLDRARSGDDLKRFYP
ncbi:hypothetical protein KSP39_PZI017378 [Platanthera zijinensis]|uniref:Integrase catalytic domain-containing protein n=1 Tax=Platanthera zijinensis TaxID=2320716 RepID=A0AAP0FZX0_9ASPA